MFHPNPRGSYGQGERFTLANVRDFGHGDLRDILAGIDAYYGENGIDAWMIPYFGASVYDDPAVYAQSSPINFMRNVKTPTFEYVGERDIECPAPQTQEFWHALKALNVPTSIMIYPGEGHGLRDPAHSADLMQRTLEWLNKYLKSTRSD